MFSPIQIKHECTTVEDVSTNNRINSSDNSIYPIFVNHQDVEYKHRQLSQFWEQSQLSEDVHIKHDIHEQQAVYQAENTGQLPYVKDYIQNGLFYQVNQEEGNGQPQTNDQCHQSTSNAVHESKTSLSQNLQSVKNGTSAIESPSAVKTSRLGRPARNSAEAAAGKKIKYQCEICFKEFGHKSNLFIHMRTHNGERPYKCSQCEKRFTHSGNLAIHMRTHSGERPYGCQVCGKMFSHSGNLSTHLRTHSGVKPYKCNVCGKEFRHSGNLSIHERIHSGVKPFQCKICGKEFYHSGNLTTHMKKHFLNRSANATEREKKHEQKHISHILHPADVNSIVDSSSFLSDMPLSSDNKAVHNNVVPIKNESTEDTVLSTMGQLTSS